MPIGNRGHSPSGWHALRAPAPHLGCRPRRDRRRRPRRAQERGQRVVAGRAGLRGRAGGPRPRGRLPPVRAHRPAAHLVVRGRHRGHGRALCPARALARRPDGLAEAAHPDRLSHGQRGRGHLHDRLGPGARHGFRLRGARGARSMRCGPLAPDHGMDALQHRCRPTPSVVRHDTVVPSSRRRRDHRRPRCLRPRDRRSHGRCHRGGEGESRGPSCLSGAARHPDRPAQPCLLLPADRRGARGAARFHHCRAALRPRPLQGDQRHARAPVRRPDTGRGRPPGPEGVAIRRPGGAAGR